LASISSLQSSEEVKLLLGLLIIRRPSNRLISPDEYHEENDAKENNDEDNLDLSLNL